MATLGQYNLEEMTEQEVFDATCKHLMEQSEKSMSDDDLPSCSYKGDNKCCAAAIFIKDYSEDMEGELWRFLISDHSQTDKHAELVSELQDVHDGHEPCDWKKELKSLANDFSLNADILDDYCWDSEEDRYLLRESL